MTSQTIHPKRFACSIPTERKGASGLPATHQFKYGDNYEPYWQLMDVLEPSTNPSSKTKPSDTDAIAATTSITSSELASRGNRFKMLNQSSLSSSNATAESSTDDENNDWFTMLNRIPRNAWGTARDDYNDHGRQRFVWTSEELGDSYNI